METLAAAHLHRDALVTLRHELHARPEVGLHLPLTQKKVLDALSGLPLEISTGTRCSSVTAVLRGKHPDRPADAEAVLLRADMDALPVTELTGLPWASQTPDAMHACGHDLHTTMLTGAAHLLTERRTELKGDVVFMFQPGEEMFDGAAVMIEEGVLDAAGVRVSAAYGLHVFASNLAHGELVSRPGPMLAAADGIRVKVTGRGGHSSAPHQAIDPIPVAAEMVLALQAYVTRRFSVFDPVVVGVGAIHGGDLHAPNAIPETVDFAASVRFWSEDTRDRFHRGVDDLLLSIARAHGATAEVEHVSGYPATITDEGETLFAGRVLSDAFGAERFRLMPDPLSGSEDFSRVLAEVPGTFIGLGAAPRGVDYANAADNHSPFAVFDDDVLPLGAAVYTELALQRLNETSAFNISETITIP